MAVAYESADVFLLDFACASVDIEALKAEHPGVQFYLQLPDILREKRTESVQKIAARALLFDGIVIKTFDEIGLVKELVQESCEWQIIGDAFLYAYNTEALAFYKSFFPEMKFILPDELTDWEIRQLIVQAEEKGVAEESDFIYKAYGYQPLMITNQCLNRNYAGCEKPLMQFADEKKNQFYITSECGQCYDVIYNGQPTVMLDKIGKTEEDFLIDGIRFSNLLLDFTIETEDEMKQILADPHSPVKRLTRGHHYKGVE